MDEVIFEVDFKNNNINIGDQVVEDQNSCTLEEFDTDIGVKEEILVSNIGEG